MKIDVLIFQIGVLFLPGLLWARIDAQFGMKIKPTETEFFIRAFQFGIISYGVVYLIYWATGKPFIFINISDVGEKSILKEDLIQEILYGIVSGFILSIIWVYASTYKIITRFLKLIRATNTYGDEDVWDYTFNSPIPAVEYVHYRDFENQIVYAGWVTTYSETEKLRELVLRDVIVYNFDGEEVYQTPMVYLARAPENVHIEFPYKREEDRDD